MEIHAVEKFWAVVQLQGLGAVQQVWPMTDLLVACVLVVATATAHALTGTSHASVTCMVVSLQAQQETVASSLHAR